MPQAIWIALLSVGGLAILNAIAVTLAHPDPTAVVAGEDLDPVTTAVVSSFGSWSTKPFAAVVLTAFLACGMAAQALTARTLFSLARDGVLPASAFLRRVDRRKAPIGAIAATTVVACLGLLFGLDSAAVGSLIAFGTAGIYVSFLMRALAALVARLRGSWAPAGVVRLGSLSFVANVLAVGWLAFEAINIAWPRESLGPAGSAGLSGLGRPHRAGGHRGRGRGLPDPRASPRERILLAYDPGARPVIRRIGWQPTR